MSLAIAAGNFIQQKKGTLSTAPQQPDVNSLQSTSFFSSPAAATTSTTPQK